jgi:hypothetical protein
MAEQPETAQQRFAIALELADLAEQMLRSRTMRKHPEYGEHEIEQVIDTWYGERPGAEQGDAMGPSIDLGRFR